jgi:hypothetical protein
MVNLRALLTDEYAIRRGRNPRYSLRAFARSLRTHHTTLSQVLSGRRRLTARAIRRLGAALHLPEGLIDGGVWPAPAGERPFVQFFVQVPNVEESVRRATDLGATILVPLSVLPDGDVMAVLKDPIGLPFVLCTLKNG